MDKQLFIIRNVVKYLDLKFNFTNIRLVCKTFDNFIMNEFLIKSINENKPLLKKFIIRFILYGDDEPAHKCSSCNKIFYNIKINNIKCAICNNKYCKYCSILNLNKCISCNKYFCCEGLFLSICKFCK